MLDVHIQQQQQQQQPQHNIASLKDCAAVPVYHLPSSSTMISLLPHDSPLLSIPNVHTRRNILLSFVLGFLLGYSALVVGSIVCLEGTRALVQILMYRRKWLDFLQIDVPRLFRKTTMNNKRDGDAPSVSYKTHRNKLTGEIGQCSLSLAYRITTRKDDAENNTVSSRLVQRKIDSQDNKEYSLEALQYLLQQVQEEEEDGRKDDNQPTTAFLYMPDRPDQGLPLYYIENKRQEQIFWARFVDNGLAFFGLHIYFLAAFIHGNLMADDVGRHMVQAALAPLLMAPYLVVQAQVQHQRRLQAWKQDPLWVCTEFETLWRYWHRLGSTIRRKIYTLIFLSAVVILFLCCGLMTVLLALAMIYSIVGWVDAEAPILRETLQCFQLQAKTVSATIVKHWWEPSRSMLGMKKYFVRIEYTAPSGEQVAKDIQSKLLYEDLERNGKDDSSSIESLVDTDYPLSGYPTLLFLSDFHHSWSLCTWHIACFGSMWFYLFTAAMALDVDLDDPPEESAVSFGVIFLTPILLLPHACVLRRKEYNEYLMNLYERGEVVNSRLRRGDEESNEKDRMQAVKSDSEGSSFYSGDESYESEEDDW